MTTADYAMLAFAIFLLAMMPLAFDADRDAASWDRLEDSFPHSVDGE